MKGGGEGMSQAGREEVGRESQRRKEESKVEEESRGDLNYLLRL